MYCPDFGDTIAVHKLIIMGQLTNERLLPEVHITPISESCDAGYELHIDIYNIIPLCMP